MRITPLRAISALLLTLAVASLAACRTPQDASAVPSYLTYDKAFVVHSVQKVASQNSDQLNGQIMLVTVTYTNPEQYAMAIAPDKFELLDLDLQTKYKGLSGGDIAVPPMAVTSLEPGKSIDLTLGFRVPLQNTSLRLVYAYGM